MAAVRVGFVRWGAEAPGWLETEIELSIRPVATAVGGEGRFVNRVGVALQLGVESLIGGARRVVFYRATMECVALEAGRGAVRFYLPPEVVRRDALRAEVKYYTVRLSVGGRDHPLTRAAVSSATLPNAEVVRNFEARVSADAPATDGVLLPQYLTPFSADPGRPGPSPIRR